MINRIIGQRMKMLRKSLKLIQTEFAHHIPGKVDYTYIGKIERGKQYPSIKMLERVAKTYGVSINYFFGEANKDVEILIQLRDVVLAWALRTQDIFSRSRVDLNEAIKAVLADNKSKTR